MVSPTLSRSSTTRHFRKRLTTLPRLRGAEGEALGLQALEELLWRKDISLKVAAKASAQSGVDETLIKKLLPGVAALMIGALARGSQDDLMQLAQRINGPPLPLPGESPRQDGDVGHQVPLPVPSDDFGRGRGGNPFDDLTDTIRKDGRRTGDGPPGPGRCERPRVSARLCGIFSAISWDSRTAALSAGLGQSGRDAHSPSRDQSDH